MPCGSGDGSVSSFPAEPHSVERHDHGNKTVRFAGLLATLGTTCVETSIDVIEIVVHDDRSFEVMK